MSDMQAEVLIIGSGAGGATVATELAECGKDVLILEKGTDPGRPTLYKSPSSLGTQIIKLFKKCAGKKPAVRKIAVRSWIGLGGSSAVSSANAVRSLERELQYLGINIKDESEELERKLKVTLFPENLMGRGALKLREAADSLGIKMEPMPKFIDFNKCKSCGNCNLKCPSNAKWSALNFLKKAQDKGASLLQNATAIKVLSSNGKAIGVKAASLHEDIIVRASIIILAAGAIETSIILHNSGLDSAGRKLFCHPFHVIYGPSKDDFFTKEPRSLINQEFVEEKGFVLMNNIVSKSSKLIKHLSLSYKTQSNTGMLGIMVKIKDDYDGRVYDNGSIHKVLTLKDLDKIESSIPIAKEILVKAGVDHRHIKIKFHSGVHPGGTAAIGELVNQSLETEIKNCYVSDASVLPSSSGLPPMLTIMALSKRLAKRLSRIL